MAILGRGAAVGVARTLADALFEIYMSRYILHGGCSNAKQWPGLHSSSGRSCPPTSGVVLVFIIRSCEAKYAS